MTKETFFGVIHSRQFHIKFHLINKHSLKHEKVTSCYLYTLQNITLYFNDKCILKSHEN